MLTALTIPVAQKTHVFVTYDGTLVHAYKNGQLVGSYTLQNCANKVPAGNRFTLGRGSSQATLYVHNVYFRGLDEGDGLFSAAEPYLQLNGSKDPFARYEGVKNDQSRDINRELSLRDANVGDANSTVYVCEEDRGEKDGGCKSDSSIDSDDLLGTVTIDPRRNGSFNTGWSSFLWDGNLHYNVQNNFFQGALDDLRIYESILTPQEVGQLVNGGGLTYQLDEASGRTQFRNAGVDATQLVCNEGKCPTSGLKGYAGQAVRFTGTDGQALLIQRLRERFGSNLVVGFWFKPEAGNNATTPVPLLRYGQGNEGFALFATPQESGTALRARFHYAATDAIGGSGGGTYDLRCNAGEALVGIYGRGGGMIDQVGALCVTPSASYESWQGEPVRRGSAGGNGGGDFVRQCPSGSYVSGFSGRAGGLVDQIQIECARPLAAGILDSRNATRLESVGGGGGNQQSSRICPSNLPANGIFGRGGSRIDAFGLLCQDQVSTTSNATLPTNQWSHVALAQNNDMLQLYVNGQPVQTIWFGPSPRAEYRLKENYTPDLTLGGSMKALMDEVQISGVSLFSARTSSVGSSGGDDYDLRCQTNEALVGLYGRAGGGVDQVGPLCAVIDPSGRWVGDPIRRGTAGGSGGGEFERLCATNAAVTGFKSRTGAELDQIQLACTPLGENGAVDPLATPIATHCHWRQRWQPARGHHLWKRTCRHRYLRSGWGPGGCLWPAVWQSGPRRYPQILHRQCPDLPGAG